MAAGTIQALPTSTNIPTQTPSIPMVSVTTATNCRTGPSVNYAFVMLFQPGMTAQVVGKYAPNYYWIITTPTGGTCWLLGSYANVQGDVSKLPEMTPPQLVMAPAPTSAGSSNQSGNNNSGNNNSNNQSSGNNGSTGITLTTPMVLVTVGPQVLMIVPAMPAYLNVASYCGNPPSTAKRTDTLTWAAVSNADGYIVYRNGAQYTKVNNKTLGLQISHNFSVTAASYGIAAYIGSTTSKIRSATPKGCQ